MVTKTETKHEGLKVVGIGTSAGGLESMTRFLTNLQPDSSHVYIVAQHMAKGKHVELVVRLLSQHSQLPVAEAKVNDRLVPGRVYILPPGFSGVVSDNRIVLLTVSTEQISTPSINALFNSIAQTYGRNGIGVILSGTGSDGVIGCRSIKAHGGRIIVQTPATSTFDGMPSSVIETGLPDHILSPEEMGKLFSDVAPAQDQEISANSFESSEATDVNRLKILKLLVQEIFNAIGNDFSDYKEETLLRRIERRIAKLKIGSFERYLGYVRHHPEELIILRNQFLISFSSFFRDADAFSVLRNHLVKLIEQKQPNDRIRIWVPSCATGEEVYTLAMILAELLGERVYDTVSIFGTDLNAEAIAMAKRGLYKANAFKEMNPQLQERYFQPHMEYWQIDSALRSVCLFECRDVLECEPLAELDLVSCRNLLIYLKPPTQDQLLRKFHASLLPHGLLFLGQSESPKLSGLTLFRPVNEDARIFRRS